MRTLANRTIEVDLENLPKKSEQPDEQTRLLCARYRQEFHRISVYTANVAKSPSLDPDDFKTDLKNLITQLQRFLRV